MKILKQITGALLMMALTAALASPMAFAVTVDPEEYMCKTPNETTTTSEVGERPLTDDDFIINPLIEATEPERYDEIKKTFDDKLSAEIKKKQQCGEVNAYTGYIEKKDCTATGQSVVEITESFATNTSYGDSGENKTVSVYKGLCCQFRKPETGECEDTRTVYFKDLESCLTSKADLCTARQWLISTSGAGLLKLYIKQIYTWGAGIAGFIAVVVIIVSGIQIQVSGISGDISSAKQRITQSLAGLALIFLSGVLLLAVNPDFFGS